MPATPAAIHEQKAGAITTAPSAKAGAAQSPQQDENKILRLHVTPFNPALLKVYLAPSVLPLAKNISYHDVETFPEKGFGYLELPAMEAQKLKKKLNGSTLKGSKVRIEEAKPEKRKVSEDVGDVKENEERPKKRSKKVKAKKEQGVLEGVVLPDGRKVKRGWTEPPTKTKKEKKENKDKEKKEKTRKESKYSKEPELLFKARLTPVAATELAFKEKSRDKKKDKKSKSKEVVVHEFEKKTNMPSFLKQSKVSTEKKPAVDYINGVGWVDEDGNVVEAETGKVRNRRVLELVDSAPVQPTTEKQQSATPSPKSSPAPRSLQKKKTKKATPPPSSSESEDAESSVVSSSSDDDSSDSDKEAEHAADSPASSPAQAPKADTPDISVTPSSPATTKEVHPLEALFKRPKPSLSLGTVTTPSKGLAPINTSFSFFDSNSGAMDVDAEASGNQPTTPYSQRDLEWRGLRSAAPTPDTAAVGRRFSFPWRKSSQEADEGGEDDDTETKEQLSINTKANASAAHLAGVAEEDEGEKDAVTGAEQTRGTAVDGEEEEAEEEESEFKKWFWENQGSLNRAWKKRRRDVLKSKRLTDNKKAVGGRKAY
ncbi:hypothetical protein CC80DRAFT_489900 [Byssothecium circinans]|uniref:Uncharacterized protein n=1 Tax=Byssothecium circinans TaxID=147558 RepID=A0A6A5U761_9PLEO|nr:hypothetical protein CC80DRAFT_489900 [Byssothecium circinans]